MESMDQQTQNEQLSADTELREAPAETGLLSGLPGLGRFQLDVELLVWLFAVCHSAKQVLSPQLAETKMRQVYAHELPPANDTAAVQRALNADMVLWEQRIQLIQLPLACATSLVFGVFSDRTSTAPISSTKRLWMVLIGLSASCLDLAARLFVWTTAAPLWLLLVSGTVVGCMGGGNFLFMCAANARVVDKDRQPSADNAAKCSNLSNGFSKFRLSARMLLFSALFSIGALLGAQLSGQLAARLTHPIAFGLNLALMLCSLPLALLLMRKKSPENVQTMEGINASKETLKAVRALPDGILRILRHGGLPFGLCLAALFLCNGVFSEENELFGVYTRLAPFYWKTEQLSLYKSIRPIAQLAAMALGALFLRLNSPLAEYGLLQSGVLSLVGVGLCVALATDSTLLFASLAVGAPHGLFAPMAYTICAQLSPPDETGTLFAVLLIVERCSLFAQSQVLQSIYRVTLNWHQQFIWLLVSALAALASVLFAMAQWQQNRRRLR